MCVYVYACMCVYACVCICVCAHAAFALEHSGALGKRNKYFFSNYYLPIITPGLPTVRDSRSEVVSARVINQALSMKSRGFIKHYGC